MNSWLSLDLLAFACGTITLLLLTPVFRRIAEKTGFMDCPAGNHKGHRKATPLLGGAAMFTGWILSLLAGMAAVCFDLLPGAGTLMARHAAGFFYASSHLSFLVLAASLAVLLGLIDDKWALSASWKFSGQFLVALIAVWGGHVRINLFLPMPWISWALSLFWLMLLMNSINFFDNMDGLAAGTIAIAMGLFTVISFLNEQYFVALFSALCCGVCCGFWFYNFNPATIFMGDSGSHFLGFLAAVVSARVTYFDPARSLTYFPVLIPLLILALPLFDTAMVVMIRTCHGKPFWIGDHNHVSHRFVRMGLDRKQAVFLVHLMALILGLSALPVYWGDFPTAIVIILLDLLFLGIITLLQFSLELRSDAREN